MKKYLFIIGFNLISLVCFPGIIPDGNTVLLSQILAQNISQLKQLEDTYRQINTFVGYASDMKQNLNKMFALQHDVQEALKKATSIKDFTFSDVSYLLAHAVPMGSGADASLGTGATSSRLLVDMNGTQGTADVGKRLYRLYHQPDHPFLFEGTDGRNNPIVDPKKSLDDQIALENFLDDQNGNAYQVMMSFANRFQQQALEIESSVKKDDLFSMNSSERIELLLKAAGLMEKSVALQTRATELLKTDPSPTVKARNAAFQCYFQQLILMDRIHASRMVSSELF